MELLPEGGVPHALQGLAGKKLRPTGKRADAGAAEGTNLQFRPGIGGSTFLQTKALSLA